MLKKGAVVRVCKKWGGQLSGWGDDRGADNLLPCLINLIVIENNRYNYHFIHNKPTLDIIHLMNCEIYTLINHPTLNKKYE